MCLQPREELAITGHSFLNSQAEGVAPAARFLAIVPRTTEWFDEPAVQWRTFFALLRDPRVDVVTMSTKAGMNARHRVDDDDSAVVAVTSRLARQYGKPSRR
jgi:hypothetical protein